MIAENVSGRAGRLAHKPEVTPLQPDGTPLPVETIVTLEEKIPPYVVLEPGQRAASRVHWGSWCGQASDRARVDWPGRLGGSDGARADSAGMLPGPARQSDLILVPPHDVTRRGYGAS